MHGERGKQNENARLKEGGYKGIHVNKERGSGLLH